MTHNDLIDSFTNIRNVFSRAGANRMQYGALNYSEGGTPDRFTQYEQSMRDSAESVNAGSVYKETNVHGARGGIMPTRGLLYLGVVRGAIVNLWGKSMHLWQYQGNPMGWSGDAPLELQPQPLRSAPWNDIYPYSGRA